MGLSCSSSFSCLFGPAFVVAAILTASPAEGKKLQVLTSILPVYCLTANVAGDLAQVENLLGAGADAHDYQFTPRDRRLLGAADLIVINGLGMEPWLERALTRSAIGGEVVECSAGLDVRLPGSLTEVRGRKPGPTAAVSEGARSAESRAANPHIWLDPLLACHMVTNILLALEKADPVHASSYESNALEYVARLQGLHEEIRRALEPYKGSSIVTYHDAFAYFARRYGLNVAGVIEEGIEPLPKHLTALRQAIQREKVKVVFSEASHPGKLAGQLGRDLGIRVAVLDSLESGPAKPAAYEEGMRRNLSVLERFLP